MDKGSHPVSVGELFLDRPAFASCDGEQLRECSFRASHGNHRSSHGNLLENRLATLVLLSPKCPIWFSKDNHVRSNIKSLDYMKSKVKTKR
jgi:hypothetical protein